MKRLSTLLVALACLEPAAAHAEDKAPATERVTERPHALIGGGLSYGQLYGIEMKATAIEGAVLADVTKHLGATVGVDVEIGKTTTGQLPIGDVAPFGTFDLVFGPLRLGAGPQLSYFWMERAPSSTRRTVDAIGLGLRARVSLDLVRFDDAKTVKTGSGIFLAVSPGFEWLRGPTDLLDFTGGTVAWRASATVGVRL